MDHHLQLILIIHASWTQVRALLDTQSGTRNGLIGAPPFDKMFGVVIPATTEDIGTSKLAASSCHNMSWILICNLSNSSFLW